jgi:lipopolysaccharide/colanic/teichoic acid biosynthesis glycosyltransferase
MLRAMDFLFSVTGLVAGSPLFAAIWMAGIFDTGVPIFRQVRLGRNQKPFVLLKFRTMRPDTGDLPTHMVSASSVTRLGKFLRRTKLDELPQLWNVMRGDMSLVGPRPGLPSHQELTDARARMGVFDARPGITGLAQLQGIDMSDPALLAATDAKMLADLGFGSYLRFVVLTALGGGSGDRVR